MSDSPCNSRLFLALGGILFSFLLAAVVTLGSLRVPFEPGTWGEKIVLFAGNTFIVAALLVFGLILGRALVRLWVERRAEQLGSRFKTKMVLGAMAVSLFPLVFLFFISYALMNRTLNRWFPQELEDANSQALALLNEVSRLDYSRLQAVANRAVGSIPAATSGDLASAFTPAARFAAESGRGRDLGCGFLGSARARGRSLESADRARLNAQISKCASQWRRVLGFAFRAFSRRSRPAWLRFSVCSTSLAFQFSRPAITTSRLQTAGLFG